MSVGLTPYPAMRDSGVPWLGGVPAHWQVQRCRYLLREVDLRSKRGEERHLSMSQRLGLVPSELVEQRTLVSENYAGGKLCKIDDIILNRLKAHLGVFAVAGHDGVISPDYTVLRSVSSTSPHYLAKVLRCDACRGELRIRAKGIVEGFWRLYTNDLYDIRLPLPPPDEQAAIIRFLTHVDWQVKEFIRAKQRLIALLEEQKQAILHRAVTRGPDPAARMKNCGDEWVGDIPEHWRVVALKRVLRCLVDCEHKTAPAVENSDYRVVRTSAVRHGELHWAGTYCTTAEGFQKWTQRALPEPGDVIFTREAPAGEACVIPSGARVCLGQRTVLMKVRNDEYDARFLVHMIYAGPPRLRIQLASQGSTVGHFNMDDIGWLKVLAPPLREQQSVVEAIERETQDLRRAAERSQREIELLREYRTRLIADVVTGKVDVREAAARLPDEPADADLPLEFEESHDENGAADSDDVAEEVEV